MATRLQGDVACAVPGASESASGVPRAKLPAEAHLPQRPFTGRAWARAAPLHPVTRGLPVRAARAPGLGEDAGCLLALGFYVTL